MELPEGFALAAILFFWPAAEVLRLTFSPSFRATGRPPQLRRWLEANPHDDFAPEVRQQLTTAPLHHVTWTREYLGWGVFVLMAR